MDLNNDTQGVCVSGTWEVPEVVEFRISMNRFDVSALGAPADTRDAAPPTPRGLAASGFRAGDAKVAVFRPQVYNDGLIFEYYEPVRLDLIEPSLGPATGVNPDGSGMTVSVTTSAFYPFVNVGGGAWLRCRFGGADGGVTQATFISPESLTCGVPANLASAGAVEVCVEAASGGAWTGSPPSVATSNGIADANPRLFADCGLAERPAVPPLHHDLVPLHPGHLHPDPSQPLRDPPDRPGHRRLAGLSRRVRRRGGRLRSPLQLRLPFQRYR